MHVWDSKKRFRVLKFPFVLLDTKDIVNIVRTCATLHNILVDKRILDEDVSDSDLIHHSINCHRAIRSLRANVDGVLRNIELPHVVGFFPRIDTQVVSSESVKQYNIQQKKLAIHYYKMHRDNKTRHA